jgi:phospholipid/cholesterol/gamma-HCH transport system permease protein
MSTMELHQDGGRATLRIDGALDAERAPELYELLRRLVRDRSAGEVELELSGLSRLDTAGIATLSLGSQMCERAGIGFEVAGLRSEHRHALSLFQPASPPLAPERRSRIVVALAGIGDLGTSILRGTLYFVELVGATLRAVVFAVIPGQRRWPRGAVISQASSIGADSLVILLPLGLVLGFIMAFQAIHELRAFGAELYVADLVGIAMVRELAPILAGIIVAGRSGSAIAAELGTMSVDEELDALRTMGVDPVRYLVAPRLLALTIVQPALNLMVTFIGLIGGYLGAIAVTRMPAPAYYDQTVAALVPSEFWIALGKSVVFAWIIGVTACFTGMRSRRGARAVGGATTRAVVASVFLIIVTDSLIAALSTTWKGGSL